ncbi:hypothetical protein NONS58_06340 [Nitrosococcus oceani]|nr:hypothetical protein NONS58_06340 [Nitrosococcus oceani]
MIPINQPTEKSILVLVLGIGMLLIPACGAKNIYEGTRQSNLNECNLLPESARQECMQRIEDNYEIYKNKREEAIRRKK